MGDETKLAKLTNYLATPLPWQGKRVSNAVAQQEMELFRKAAAGGAG